MHKTLGCGCGFVLALHREYAASNSAGEAGVVCTARACRPASSGTDVDRLSDASLMPFLLATADVLGLASLRLRKEGKRRRDGVAPMSCLVAHRFDLPAGFFEQAQAHGDGAVEKLAQLLVAPV